jgi:hypothetical protein
LDGSLLFAMSDFLDPGSGPDQSGDFRVSPTFFVVVLLLGFLIGTFGHVVKSRALVALGIGLVFSATVALPVVVALSH